MKLVLLWLTFAVAVYYLILPYSEETFSFFPYSEQRLSLAMHVWFICEKAILIILSWIILQESNEYKFALWIFFGCQVFKLIDYLICYNKVWDYWGEIPITSNTLSVLFFTIAIVYEFFKRHGDRG